MIFLYSRFNALYGVLLVYCAKCGEENSGDSDYCARCGASIGSNQASHIVRSEPMFGVSRSVSPGVIVGVIIIIVGLTFSLGQNIGQIAGEWGESFGDSMGTWGENFGESMGAWGEDLGRMFSEWGMGWGSYLGAFILILIGVFIVTRSLRRNSVYT